MRTTTRLQTTHVLYFLLQVLGEEHVPLEVQRRLVAELLAARPVAVLAHERLPALPDVVRLVSWLQLQFCGDARMLQQCRGLRPSGRTQERAGHPQREHLRGHVLVQAQLVGAGDGLAEGVHGGRGGVLYVQHDGHVVVEVNARGYRGTLGDFVGCGGGGCVGRGAGS